MAKEKASFIIKPPFKKVREYKWWLRITLFLVFFQILVMGYFSFREYRKQQELNLQKNSLEKSLTSFDDIVRKKNKLLSEQERGAKYSKRNQNTHVKVAGYLQDIEKALPHNVILNTFEFAGKKVSINGYSRGPKKLTVFIANLKRLKFVKDLELEHISRDKKRADGKLRFVIDLKV